MFSTRLVATAIVGLSMTGCAPVVAAGIFYDHAKSREDRAAFTADFRKQNLEREKAGLQPLDWCTELYRTKASWYAEDATCNKRTPSKSDDAPRS